MTTYLDGNRLTLLESGAEYFPALEQAIDEARTEIHLETYIYADDGVGRRITDALCRASRRGVRVHVLVDGFGARDMALLLREAMRDAGVGLLVYRRNVSPWTLRRTRLRRMHRKLAVVDGRIAFVGGINVIDDRNAPGEAQADTAQRHDYALRIEGPLLAPIHHQASRLWRWVALANLQRVRPRVQPVVVDAAPKGTQRAAFLVRDNIRHRFDIEDAYLEAIDAAREEILIANAYFLPGTRFRLALARAARRKVRVVLLLQGRVEYVLQHYATRALYASLLDAGVEIHEYHEGFLHAKVAVIDARWATVGSSNIDPFSLALAREANVVVDDAPFAGELRVSLLEAMRSGGVALARTGWLKQPLWRRLPIWLAYALVRALLGVAGLAERR
jgi:cardiolipin synthase